MLFKDRITEPNWSLSGEVCRLVIACQNDVDFIADVFRIDSRPLDQTPNVFEVS